MTTIIAHRGFAAEGGAEAPENSVPAVRRAAPTADAVEIDIRRCATGELVVYHDAHLDRLTDASGPVADTDFDTLRSLDLDGSDAQIPTPAEVFEAVPAATSLYLHLKEPGLVNDLLTVYCDGEHDNAFMFTSESKRVLSEIPSAIPSAYSVRQLPDNDGDADADAAEGVQTAIDETLALGCDEIHPHRRLCVETEIVEQAHTTGLKVAAWTVRTEEQFDRLLDTAVDAIHTDIAPAPSVAAGDC